MSFDIFKTCASGMYAQKTKMDTIAANMANINTTRKDDGSIGPYVKKTVTFKAIYDNQTTPRDDIAFPSGANQVRFNSESGNLSLRGGISYDQNKIAKGVEVQTIEESKNPYKTVYDPSHPDADEEGFVTLPNINIVEEMVNMISASKAYEANATIVETTKNMISTALKI